MLKFTALALSLALRIDDEEPTLIESSEMDEKREVVKYKLPDPTDLLKTIGSTGLGFKYITVDGWKIRLRIMKYWVGKGKRFFTLDATKPKKAEKGLNRLAF